MGAAPLVLALLAGVWPCFMISALDSSVQLCATCVHPIKSASCERQVPGVAALSVDTNACIKVQKPDGGGTVKCTLEVLIAEVKAAFPVGSATTKVTLVYEIDSNGHYTRKVGVAEEFCPVVGRGPFASTAEKVFDTAGKVVYKAGKVVGEFAETVAKEFKHVPHP